MDHKSNDKIINNHSVDSNIKNESNTSKNLNINSQYNIQSSNGYNNINKYSVNQFLKKERTTCFNNYVATTSSYQRPETHQFSFNQCSFYSSYSSSFKQKKIISPNRQWKYTEYGKDLKELNFNKEKLAKFDASNTNKTKYYNTSDSSDSKKYHSRPFIFKICTYNILAPDLVEKNRDLYKKVDFQSLQWKNRKYKIYNDIKRLNADIYCFQEMQEDQFNSFFLSKLKKKGYECYFKKRYGELKLDGCALCFSQRKFELVKIELIDFYRPNIEILNRENVGIVALLRAKTNSKIENNDKEKLICVATSHILYNPKRGDCKLAQIQLLLAHIDKMAYKSSKLVDNNKLVPTYWPVIFCGDFNCSNTSKLYEFITMSKLKNYKNLNRNDLSGQFHKSTSFRQIESPILPENLGISDQSQFLDEVNGRVREANDNKNRNINENSVSDDLEAYCSYGGSHLRHNFNFKSAYSHKNENGDLEISSIVGDEPKKTVDFIFYHNESIEINEKKGSNIQNTHSQSEDKEKGETSTLCKKRSNDFQENINDLELIANLELFTLSQLEDVYLPNDSYPSDHFLLASKFALN